MRHDASRHDGTDTKPLTEPVVLILTSLATEPRHGYALLKDIEALSGGRVSMSTGTLYGALRRLLDDHWIERFDQDDTSRDKQAYRLTAAGRKNLQAELDRMKQLMRTANLRLRASVAQ
jgi:DNA-binding PadR family transcriptional regulator